MRLYWRILSYLKPHLATFLAAVAATFAFAALDAFSLALLIPFLETLFGSGSRGSGGAGTPGTSEAAGQAAGQPEAAAGAGDLLDRLFDISVGRFVDPTAPPLEAVQTIVIFIIVVFLVKNLFDFVRAYLVAVTEQSVTRDLRDEVYDHLLTLDLSFFGRTRTGQVISRLTHDVDQLRRLVTKELGKVISSVFEFLAALAFALAISVKLTLAAFLVVPLTMGIWGPLLKKLRRGDRRVLDTAGEISSHIQETVSGIRLVKTAVAEEHERSRFRGWTQRYYKAVVRAERLRAMAAPATEMLAAIGTGILLWYGARLVLLEGELTGPEFIAFLGISMKLYSPVKYLAKFPTLVQPGLVGAERIFEFLDAPADIEDRPDARPFPGLEERIQFDGVTFAYREGEPVLKNIELEVRKGQVIALVGPSGAGKSTLVDLLGRFKDPDEGAVRIDGVDVKDFRISELRSALGIVSQETVLFHDTIRSNIAYGLGEVSDEAIEKAARAAHAHGFIMELPEKYDTLVGERGTSLSGGQRQRIAIARAILRDPPILIFDEATSALDTESERLVQDAVEKLLEGRTVFVIAHRLSTVRAADQILVMERGRIVERGRHEELLERGGLYRKLHEMQFQEGEEAG